MLPVPAAAAEAEEDDGPHIPGLTTQQVTPQLGQASSLPRLLDIGPGPQVHTLLHVLCEETELAELELKVRCCCQLANTPRSSSRACLACRWAASR